MLTDKILEGSKIACSSEVYPVDNFGTVVGENPDCLLLSGTVVGENPDHVCWVRMWAVIPHAQEINFQWAHWYGKKPRFLLPHGERSIPDPLGLLPPMLTNDKSENIPLRTCIMVSDVT